MGQRLGCGSAAAARRRWIANPRNAGPGALGRGQRARACPLLSGGIRLEVAPEEGRRGEEGRSEGSTRTAVAVRGDGPRAGAAAGAGPPRRRPQHPAAGRRERRGRDGAEWRHSPPVRRAPPSRARRQRPRRTRAAARRAAAGATARRVGPSGEPNRPAPALQAERDRTLPPGPRAHSTVTLFARFRGWSTSQPRRTAMWYARSCSGTVARIGVSASCVRGIWITWSR